MKISVLDKGYVELLGIFGDDFNPVESARVSYDGEKYADIERNLKLLEYLYKNKHLSTTESIIFKFRVKAPIFVFRQWHRHRLASISERSLRYTEFTDDFYVPKIARLQSLNNKQDSVNTEDEKTNIEFVYTVQNNTEQAIRDYNRLLALGIAREQARIILPVNVYSEMIWTVNLRSLMNFLEQRLDSHAQFEIREYAKGILEIFRSNLPANYEMFMKYIWRKDEDNCS